MAKRPGSKGFLAVATLAALAFLSACHSQPTPTVAPGLPQAAARAPEDTAAPNPSHRHWDKGPKLLPHQPPPTYRVPLQQCGVEGSVMTAFVIDENGRADMSTFKVIKSDNSLFTAAVRAKLPSYRFGPATLRGTPVRAVVTMPFNFSIRPSGPANRIRRPPDVSGGLPLSDTQRPAC
jgi:outer membrane biosynthesis protein TonB